jgi:hypothetical protein
VSLFYSAGTATQTGMGLVSLSWQEIAAWVQCAGYEDILTPWELSVIKRMSEAYAAEYSQASAPMRRKPYEPEVDLDEVDRDEVVNKAKNILSGFKKRIEKPDA